MDAMKMKVLEELLSHLSSSQGMDLKSMLDESKMPKPEMASMSEPESEDEMDEMGKPKGIKIESVEVMGKPEMEKDKSNPLASNRSVGKTLGETIGYPGSGKDKLKMDGEGSDLQAKMDPEMTDDEFEELLKKYA